MNVPVNDAVSVEFLEVFLPDVLEFEYLLPEGDERYTVFLSWLGEKLNSHFVFQGKSTPFFEFDYTDFTGSSGRTVGFRCPQIDKPELMFVENGEDSHVDVVVPGDWQEFEGTLRENIHHILLSASPSETALFGFRYEQVQR